MTRCSRRQIYRRSLLHLPNPSSGWWFELDEAAQRLEHQMYVFIASPHGSGNAVYYAISIRLIDVVHKHSEYVVGWRREGLVCRARPCR